MSNDGVVEFVCEHCSRVFERRKYTRGRKPKYCSGTCRNLAYEERKGIVRKGKGGG